MRETDSNEHIVGPYRIRSDERVLRLDGRDVPLSPKVADTLLALLERTGGIVSNRDLLDRIWPEGWVAEANLTQNIYVLRKLFAQHGSGIRIENVPKRGYRLVEPPPDVELRRPKIRSAPARVGLCCVLLSLLAIGLRGSAVAPPVRCAGSPFSLPAAALAHDTLGRFYLNRGTLPDLRRSRDLFSKLIAECPQSALGYAGLADSLTSLTFTLADPAARTALGAQAVALANTAVAYEPSSVDAYAALGAVQASIEHNDPAATSSFERALRLDPRNFDALVWYGTGAMNAGHVGLARRLFERSLSVDPAAPGPIASLAWADFLGRHFADSAAFSQQLLRSHHLESMARITLASAYVEMRDFDRALPQVQALQRAPATRIQGVALLSQIEALRGRPRVALDALAQLQSQIDPSTLGSWDIIAIAAAYTRLGRPDDAFVWLARIESSERRQLARDPRFDGLRSDRRFQTWVSD